MTTLVRHIPACVTLEKTTGANDEELLRDIATGDAQALGELYDRHVAGLFSLAVRIVGQRRAAEDTLAALFTDVWRRPAAYQSASTPVRSSLVTNLRRLALQQQSRRPDSVMSPTSDSERSMPAGSQDSPLARLPALQRRSIELAFFGGLSLTQIALRLNETKESIRLAIADGMRACR